MKTVEWCNLNKLESYKKLLSLKGAVSVKNALKGAAGAKRIADFSIPMSSGLAYNYTAKEVNRQILSIFKSLVKEASLIEKFSALYNGEVVNTGERHMVLHHLTRNKLDGNCNII